MRLAIRERIRRMGEEGIGAASLGLRSLDYMALSLRRDMIFSLLEVVGWSYVAQLENDTWQRVAYCKYNWSCILVEVRAWLLIPERNFQSLSGIFSN